MINFAPNFDTFPSEITIEVNQQDQVNNITQVYTFSSPKVTDLEGDTISLSFDGLSAVDVFLEISQEGSKYIIMIDTEQISEADAGTHAIKVTAVDDVSPFKGMVD